MTRPEILFPLFAGLETLDGVGPRTAEAMAGLGVTRPRDLIFLLPHSGIDRTRRGSVRDVVPPATVTVEVTIGPHQPPRRSGGPTRVIVRDAALEFHLVYFHARGEALQRLLPTGQRRVISGRVELFDGIAQMVHPDHVLRPEEAGDLPLYEPVYPLSGGLTQRQVAKAVASALRRVPDLPDWINPAQMQREGWPGWKAAVMAVHGPRGDADLALTAPARTRLAYDEFFAHQLTLALARATRQRARGVASQGSGVLQDRVLAALPYAPTKAQRRAIARVS